MSPEKEYSYNPSQLRLTDLTCDGFRVYSHLDLSLIQQLIIFTGSNAVGKTSLLEAIQLMTSFHSFRTSSVSQMIQWGSEVAHITAHIQNNDRDLDLSLTISQHQRTYTLNGKKKHITALSDLLPAVIFTPDDLLIMKGPPAVRRKQIDALGVQISKNYYAVRADYIKLIKQKNQALKEELSDAYIDSIDDMIVRVGVQMLQHRMYLISKLQPVFQEYYRVIANKGESATLLYYPCWLHHKKIQNKDVYVYQKEEAKASLTKELASHREVERFQHRSVTGPHTDEVAFLINGHDATHFASQGQQRSLVLAYKLAELTVIQEICQQRPILLLDDVMSELDEYRRGCFMEFIADDIQTFITTTNLSYFSDSIRAKADIYELIKQPQREDDVSRETFYGTTLVRKSYHDENK